MGIEKTKPVTPTARFDIAYMPHDDGTRNTHIQLLQGDRLREVNFDAHQGQILVFDGIYTTDKLDFAMADRQTLTLDAAGYQAAYSKLATWMLDANTYTMENFKNRDSVEAGGYAMGEVNTLTQEQMKFTIAAMAMKDGVDVSLLPGMEKIGVALNRGKDLAVMLRDSYGDQVIDLQETSKLIEEMGKSLPATVPATKDKGNSR